MNKDVANHIVYVAFKSSSAINDLLPLLKQHCTEDEYIKYKRAIASVTAEINLNILHLVYNDFPEIQKEVEEKLEKYNMLI